jgi:GMP synthase (glutamine-hydrolysing)
VRKILVCQHVPFEMLGTLDPLLKAYGFRIRYVNFGRDPAARPRLDRYDGLVLLGGPMNVDQLDAHPHLRTEVALVREAIACEMPVLGICLGAQLVARALGARVEASPEKEIGWYEVCPTEAGRRDPVLGAFGESETIFQWHGDTFAIPPHAVHLASSPACPNQAFRYGDRVYGFQFHLEVDERLIERWLGVPVHREELARLGGRIRPETIRRDTARHASRARALSDETFARFVELFSDRRRRHRHPHA